MGLIEDQNPLRTKLAKDLHESEWMQKFKALSEMLQRVKTELPITEQCTLRWDTDQDWLSISCPNEGVKATLIQQSSRLAQLTYPAKQVILKLPNHQDVFIQPKDLPQP